ncbi:gamma-glutamyltransferase, partial [Mycobacterium tuberculosis]|nr:gamma-glutamyltransferase [Mycobacterium tuberculosis]
LAGRGYTVTVQRPWSAVEAILVGAKGAGAEPLPSFGDDSARTPGVVAGRAYGANDARRPAGAAVGE